MNSYSSNFTATIFPCRNNIRLHQTSKTLTMKKQGKLCKPPPKAAMTSSTKCTNLNGFRNNFPISEWIIFRTNQKLPHKKNMFDQALLAKTISTKIRKLENNILSKQSILQLYI